MSTTTRRTFIAGASALAVILLAGGCTGSASPGLAEPAASPATRGSMPPPAASGDESAVDQAVAAALDEEFSSAIYADLRSFIVLAHGRTAYERYFASEATDHHHVFSITKSVISTLIGIAIAEGKMSGVDATLAQLLPDYSRDMTKAAAGTTLEQLLTMTGGFNDESPQPTAEDWVANILDKQPWAPGSDWFYSDNSAHLAAAILAEATGTPVLEYARAKLFDPLGIPSTPAAQQDINDPEALAGAGFGWAVDPQGINVGGLGLRLRAQDLARIGQLYLQDGVWDGEQVVPEAWVRRATTKQADNGHDGYGYLWWPNQIDGDPMFAALGSGGQRILVVPNRELVVVYQVWTDPATGNREQAIAAKLDQAFGSIIAPAYGA